MIDLDTSRIAIIGPGRLGTALAYKFGRDNRRVTMYYHDPEVCRAINADHLNPKHLTADLAKKLGGMDRVPRLSRRVLATNDLEMIVEDHDIIFVTVTMQRLSDLFKYLKPLVEKKEGQVCFLSPIKGLIADEKTGELITPSQLINHHLFNLRHKYHLVSIGGPFFDVDIALGNPVCLSLAGNKKITAFIRDNIIKFNRRELYSYYNFDMVGVEACGALKNIVANIKGLSDSLDLGDSIPGTLFSRSGVEIRSITRILGGSFQAFHSQAGVGDLYVTLSSEASKNYRYGRLYYQLFNGNPIETHLNTLSQIDGMPEGPNTIRNVYRYLEKKNMYSPLFECGYRIFNEARDKDQIREMVIQAVQFDRREREYIGPFSRMMYRLMPNRWYRRREGFLNRPDG
ncbi:MAG: NAD(P)-binding domain-containing protein [Smithellaceae bacterium]|nr:NAD(P)-binding domain-containing protein [Smithellaceae bacterium]